MKMKDSKALLLEYLASIRAPERAASLFADDGTFELPFLRYQSDPPWGCHEIAALTTCSNSIRLAFAADDIHVLIETPEKTLRSMWRTRAPLRPGERPSAVHRAPRGGGQRLLLRETFNLLAQAQAQLPNGVADIDHLRRGALLLIECELPPFHSQRGKHHETLHRCSITALGSRRSHTRTDRRGSGTERR
jgi:hypothetical protein